jgi:hypothetical protein
MIGASDTVLTLELRKKSRDVARGDVLKVHRVVKKSNTIPFLIGIGIGIGVGAAVGAAIEPEYTDDPGLAAVVLGGARRLVRRRHRSSDRRQYKAAADLRDQLK